MNVSVTKRKMKFIWIYFHEIILKPQRELFVTLLISLIPVLNYPLEIECYHQHSLLSVQYKHRDISKKDIKEQWTQYGALGYTMEYIFLVANRLAYYYLSFSITQIILGFVISTNINFCYKKRMIQCQMLLTNLLVRHRSYLDIFQTFHS